MPATPSCEKVACMKNRRERKERLQSKALEHESRSGAAALLCLAIMTTMSAFYLRVLAAQQGCFLNLPLSHQRQVH